MSLSSRQAAIIADLRKGGGGTVSLDPPDSGDRPAFTDDTVARSVATVFEWVCTGQEPPAREPELPWLDVAARMRVMFAGPAEAPAITPAQLVDLVRAAYHRTASLPTASPGGVLSPAEYAGWRAAAIHCYNCVLADMDSIRENPLAERERMIVAQARNALAAV